MKVLKIVLSALWLTYSLHSTAASSSEGIQWHKAGMESALKLAAEKKQPLFVYWGASWCPPCHVVKSTHFKSTEVIQATTKYIAVYLDGDTQSAQTWGEKLQASGYPTLMVLNPKGEEVVRFSSAMSSPDFAEALNSAFYNLNPIEDILERALAVKPNKVKEQDLRSLASYSLASLYKGRSPKRGPASKPIDWAQSYEELYKRTPASLASERDQFLLRAIVAKYNGRDKDEKFSTAWQKEKRQQVLPILKSASRFQQNYKVLSFYADRIVKSLFNEKSTEREQFMAVYKKSLKTLRESGVLKGYNYLVTFYPLNDLAKIDDKKALPKEREYIKKEMLKEVKKIQDENAQAFVTNSSSYILSEAGYIDLAKEVLLKDIKASKRPYYSMSSLSEMEKELGNSEAALKWGREAYKAAKGSATRIQWGSLYLRDLMELRSENKKEILGGLNGFFKAHLKTPDAFMGRNKRSLERLAKKAKTWADEKKLQGELAKMQKGWSQYCESKKQGQTATFRKSCQEYMAGML